MKNKILYGALMAATAVTSLGAATPVLAADLAANGTGTVPVNISVEATAINVTVPTSIDMAVAADTVDATFAGSDSYKITNNQKTGVILVDSITATAKSGWTLKDASYDFANASKNSKNLYLGTKLGNDTIASLTTTYTPVDKEIKSTGTKALAFEGKTNSVSTPVSAENVVDLTITVSHK